MNTGMSFLASPMHAKPILPLLLQASGRTEFRIWWRAAWAFVSFRKFSAVLPGIETRPLIEPEVSRKVCLLWMAGRRHSPPVAAFIKLAKSYPWPESRFAKDEESAKTMIAER